MKIEIYSDIACPWCFIGERRVYQALASLPELQAEVVWRPFQLRPDMPKEGLPWREFADEKFGGWERARSMFKNLERNGEPDGIRFDFENLAAAINTLDAHRLVLLAAEQGKQREMVAALFSAYFEQNLNVGLREVLLQQADKAGVTGAVELLDSDRFKGDVAESQDIAYASGINGVPFYIIDEKYGISGAQPVTVLKQALEKVAAMPKSQKIINLNQV